MTNSYTNRVSRVRLLGFPRLLLMWKASIYKLLYREILIYCVFYTAISLVYRLALKNNHKKNFAKIVFYFGNFESLIPITFILGFYVTLVAQRWWNQYMNIPWPDRILPYVANHVTGADERGRMLRRTLMRYLMISETLIFQSISPTVKVRFPTLDHIVEAGIMTKEEKKLYENLPSPHHKYWVPCQWFANLLYIARQEGRIVDDYGYNVIYNEMIKFKSSLGTIYSYDWVSIPLVYTQVATISVYVFFFTSLVSRQFIDPQIVKDLTGEIKHEYMADLYVPGFTIFQLFFYLGWLKVAEQMINPFGEDDDDFDVNYVLDRNFQVAMMAVDHMYCQVPALEKDQFWDDREPQLPYTRASQRYYQEETWMGSMAHINFPESTSAFVPLERISESNVNPTQTPEIITNNNGNVFGSGSTFVNHRKGRLSWKFLRNSRFDFLKSAPQIHSNSLYDLEAADQPSTPIIHGSVPHVQIPCQPFLSFNQRVRGNVNTPSNNTTSQSNVPPTGACQPPESEGEAEKMVKAWIQDMKNNFPSKEALSNSTGHLTNAIASGTTSNGNSEVPLPSDPLLSKPDNPAMIPSNHNSLCDLRFIVSSPIVEDQTSSQEHKDVTDLVDEKRVAFEADTHGSSSNTNPSNNSTLDSICGLVGRDGYQRNESREGHGNGGSESSDSEAAASVIAVVNQKCSESVWPIRKDSLTLVVKSY